jgi:hypothetical protein
MAAVQPEPWLWALITTNNNNNRALYEKLVPDILEQPVALVFKGQAIGTLKDGTDW